MNVLILHGWAVSSRYYWIPYIKKELLKSSISSLTPNLPNSKLPKFNNWSKIIIKGIKSLKSPKVVIGHSLGGLALLRTLEKKKLYLDLAVFIGVPLRINFTKQYLSPFFKKDYDWAKIRRSVKKVVVIHAKNDKLVDPKNAKELAKNLKAELIITNNGGHFIQKTFPLLKKILLQEMKKL